MHSATGVDRTCLTIEATSLGKRLFRAPYHSDKA